MSREPKDQEEFKIEPGSRDSSLQPGKAEDEERLELPPRAIVALRKSGGVRFSTRTLIVYADGEAMYTYGSGSTSMARSAALELTEAQLAHLRRTLAGIDFSKLPARPRRVSPDAFVYEIAARSLGRIHYLEAWDGSVPRALRPLIAQLRRLMPVE